MTMLESCQQVDWLAMESESTQSQVDSPVRTLVPLALCGESDRVQTVSDQGCGVSSPVLLAKLNRDMSSWKTCQLSLLATLEDGSEEYSVTWPRYGTMRNGIAYQLAPSVPATTGKDSGLLPTPTNRDWKGAVKPETLAKKGRNADTNSLPDAIEYRGQHGRLNPQFVEWLMGFPVDHTELRDLETP